MPHQAMGYGEHVVLLPEGHVPIGQSEIVGIRLGMDAFPLESIFRRDGVELRLDDRIPAAILARDLGGADCRANQKVAPVGLFQRRASLCARSHTRSK